VRSGPDLETRRSSGNAHVAGAVTESAPFPITNAAHSGAPLRESLSRLVVEGLVLGEDRRGFRVAPTTGRRICVTCRRTSRSLRSRHP
jgi:hypothetical protein